MACLFLDDYGYYDTPQLASVYSAVDTSFTTWAIEPTGGPFGDGCVLRTATSTFSAGSLAVSPLFYQPGVWSQQAYGYLGGYLKIDDITKISNTNRGNVLNQAGTFLTILNGSLANCCVFMNPNGTFSLVRVGTTLDTSLAAISSNVWAHVQMGWYLSQGSDGWFIIKVDNNVVMSFTGRTSPQASDMFPFQPPPPFYNSIRVVGVTSDSTSPFLRLRWSNFWFLDGVASADPANPVNTFLGPKQIKHILTNDAGDETNWTPLSAPNWSQVNAVPPVGDLAYVETASAGTRDTYNYQDVVGNPIALMVAAYLRKTTSAAGNWSNIFRQNGTDYDGPVHGLSGTDFTYVTQPYDTNPATGLRYTEAEMNAGQWGPLS